VVGARTGTHVTFDRPPGPARLPAVIRAHRVPLLLALLAIVVVGPVVALDSAQPASRIALSAALVEHHSVNLGPYRSTLGVDRATYRDQLRSDKAPGQPLFAVPVYAIARAVGAQSADHLRVRNNLSLWSNTVWSATLPFAVLLALLYAACARSGKRGTAVAVAVCLGFGTLLLPFAVNLFGHDLAAVLGFGAWLAVEETPITPRRAVFAGVLAGAAVAVEYESAIIVVVVLAWLVARDRRRVRAFLLGCGGPLLTLGWYQWRAFGAPWRTPAAFYSGVLNGTSRGGYAVPSVSELGGVLFGGRGLWLTAPVAIVGIGSAAWLASRGSGRARAHAVVALAVVVPYVVLCAGWSGTPLLEDPGPRYLIPALPFLAVPLAATWERVRVVAVPAAFVGGLFAAAATWTQLLVPQGTSLLTADRYRVQHLDFVPTVWSMGLGRVGVVLYGASVIAVVIGLVGLVGKVGRESGDEASPLPAAPVRVSA